MRIQQVRPSVFVFLVLLAFMLAPLSAASHGSHGSHSTPGHHTHGHKPMRMEMANEGHFKGAGKVIALVPAKNQIVLSHEEIKGFMAAMPMGMGYPVSSPDLLRGLQPGDPITFTIDAARKQIIAIEKQR